MIGTQKLFGNWSETKVVQAHHVATKLGQVDMHEHVSEDRRRRQGLLIGEIGQLETPPGDEG